MQTATSSPTIVSTARAAVTHGTPTVEAWVDLLVADDDWVRREFEEIVAAGWGGEAPPPLAPHQGARRPHRPGHDARPAPARQPADVLEENEASARQRGPP
jgi:hypothetical protein